MKTAEQLLLEMEAEIVTKVAESVEMNREEIDKYVESKKIEAYDECVAKVREAVEIQYKTAKAYLMQLVAPKQSVEEETSLASVANEVNANEQPINEDVKEPAEQADSVEGPVTL